MDDRGSVEGPGAPVGDGARRQLRGVRGWTVGVGRPVGHARACPADDLEVRFVARHPGPLRDRSRRQGSPPSSILRRVRRAARSRGAAAREATSARSGKSGSPERATPGRSGESGGRPSIGRGQTAHGDGQDGSASATRRTRDLLDPTTDAFVRASGPASRAAVRGTAARPTHRPAPGPSSDCRRARQRGRGQHARLRHGPRRRPDGGVTTSADRPARGWGPAVDGAVALDTTDGRRWRRQRDHRAPHAIELRRHGVQPADVLAAIGGRDEAGHVGWVETIRTTRPTPAPSRHGSVNVDISLEMPSWTPPATMLPKAKAEWTRWYAALAGARAGPRHARPRRLRRAGEEADWARRSQARRHAVQRPPRRRSAPRATRTTRPTTTASRPGPCSTWASRRSSWTRSRRRRTRRPRPSRRTSAVPDVPRTMTRRSSSGRIAAKVLGGR